jgi:8-oxo-dGTP pyrophosphatase MutT (NUDIX family)
MGVFKLAAAVHGILRDNSRILLMRRAGSGYHDGELDLPSGHLEGGEDALHGLQRELREELGIRTDPESCQLALVIHRAPEFVQDDEYIDLLFAVGSWSGTPTVAEPDHCSELAWVDAGALSDEIIPHVRDALKAVASAQSLMLYGWPTGG